MTKAEKKKFAREVLAALGKIADRPKNDDGSLDTIKFNQLPEVKKVVAQLKDAGINKPWLWDNGFISAGLILNFK